MELSTVRSGCGDLVAEGAVEPGRPGRVRVGVLVRIAGVTLVAELREDDEHAFCGLSRDLDVLGRLLALVLGSLGDVTAELDDGASAASLDRGRVSVEDGGDRFLRERAALVLERVG